MITPIDEVKAPRLGDYLKTKRAAGSCGVGRRRFVKSLQSPFHLPLRNLTEPAANVVFLGSVTQDFDWDVGDQKV
jgi:hypothetical protein